MDTINGGSPKVGRTGVKDEVEGLTANEIMVVIKIIIVVGDVALVEGSHDTPQKNTKEKKIDTLVRPNNSIVSM